MKKISWFFCLVFLFLVNISVSANGQSWMVWNGTIDTSWYINNPTASEYEISTAEQLAGLAQLVNDGTQSFSGRTVRLTLDVILNDTTNLQNWGTTPPANEWTAIGISEARAFRGTFDGQGNEVMGVYINRPDEYGRGLFGVVDSGIIRNVGVVSSYIRAWDKVGGLVGSNIGGIVADSYNRAVVIGIGYEVGGVVGWNNAGTVTNSYNSGSVSGEFQRTGGVVGVNNFGTVTASHNSGAVSGIHGVGGLVGGNGGSIATSYNSGLVSGTNGVGGVTGFNDGSITNSYNSSSVSGGTEVGGVVGANTGTVTNVYNSGLVTGDNLVGGVVGMNEGGTITNCYFLVGTAASGVGSGLAEGTGSVTPKTEAQFTSGEVAWLLQGEQEVLTWGHTVLNAGEFPRLIFERPEVRRVSRASGESQGADYQFVNVKRIPDFLVKLGPNPIRDNLIVTISDAGDYVGRVVRLSVYDSRGRAFRREEIVINGVYDEVEVDVSQLSAGVCFVVLEVEGFDAKRVTFAKVSD